LRVNDGTHLHPQATKHRKKRKKMRELDFMLKFGDGAHPLLEATKPPKKRELAFVESWRWCPPKLKPKPKPKKKKKEKRKGCVPLSSCFQTLCSSSSKFSTFQTLSFLNPNAKPTSDGVIIRGMWGG
jgi:hypothetical protein